jgi:hypothetical protein
LSVYIFWVTPTLFSLRCWHRLSTRELIQECCRFSRIDNDIIVQQNVFGYLMDIGVCVSHIWSIYGLWDRFIHVFVKQIGS